jgi:hypothetical protein
MEILRDEDDYDKNKKLIKVFQNNVMVPLEWANINMLMFPKMEFKKKKY